MNLRSAMTILVAAAILAASACLPLPLSAQQATLTGGAYMLDPMLVEMLPYTMGGWRLRAELGVSSPDGSDLPRGVVLKSILRNTQSRPLDVTGVWLDGIDLAKQIVPKHKEHGGVQSAGYLLNSENETPPALRAKLDSLGRPAWFQVRPNPVPPGGFAEVSIRLQGQPEPDEVKVQLSAQGWKSDEVSIRKSDQPALRLAAVNFDEGIRRLYLYLRRNDGAEFGLRDVRLDGKPLALPGSVSKSSSAFLPVVLELPAPLPFGSFHLVEVTDSTGQTARNVVRARDDFYALGMWGYRNNGNSTAERARDTTRTFHDHLFNTHMMMAGEQSGYLLGTDEGFSLLQEMGLRAMSRDPSPQDIRSPWTYARFVMDEPDAHDYFASDLDPADLRLGTMGQGVVERQRDWTGRDQRSLCLLNIDNTYVPYNYLAYGAIPDILALDPYYIESLRGVYKKNPERISQYFTPMYVMGTSEFARAAAEPRPTHVILNSTSYRYPDEEPFRFPTPEEKRLEFYMALGAGAKGISYWWFTPIGECYGCGSSEPEAVAMMKELARLNAEARALLPELGVACPAARPGALNDPFATVKPYWVLARTLVAGPETAIVTMFNRNHHSDINRTIYAAVEKATVTFTPPAWLNVRSAFRVEGGKMTELTFERDGGSLVLDMGRLELADMVVFTSDTTLIDRVRERWKQIGPKLEAVVGAPSEAR